MKIDLSTLSLHELRDERDKRIEEMINLQHTEFNKRHREIFQRLHSAVQIIENLIDEKIENPQK